MVTEDTLKVGLIGLGRVAWMLEDDPLDIHPNSHAGAWQAVAGARIAAGCDSDPERRAAFSARYPDARVYADYAQMLAAEALDCVSVCAYATERCEMVLAALDAGVKGIWAEKAMACSLAEADLMVAALARHDAHMCVSYVRRWEPRYRKVRALLDDKAIGRLQGINVEFTGNFLHTGTHAFDLLRYFAGEVIEVQAWLEAGKSRVLQSGYQFSGDDADDADLGGNAVLQFENGVFATVHGRNKGYFRFELELIGSHGKLRVGNTQLELWQRAESTHYTDFKELRRVRFPHVRSGNLFVNTARELAQVLRKGGEVSCTVHDGRAALAIALALHTSQMRGHAPVRPEDVERDLYVPSR